eukprot:g3418.t1
MKRIKSLSSLARRIVPPINTLSSIHLSSSTYDYIIIGAGSAGCVLANELSASGEHSVLLLEAGGWDWRPLHHIPAGVYSVFKDPNVNWNFNSEPEPHAGNRQIELPRGRVLGGSSAINAMVYMRGHPKDYDRWAEDYGLSHWSWQHCLPYFKKCEHSDRRDSTEHRGQNGRLHVTQGNMENPLYEALLTAGEQSGQGVSNDLNGYKPEGLARLDRTASPEGRRCSSADAHLYPAMQRKNLDVKVGVDVQKIIFDGKRAIGVKLPEERDTDGGNIIKANRSVILCAGAIKTPHLLMLSGVGPKEQLENHGIRCHHDLPGVGQNLQDHACAVISYHSTPATKNHSLSHLSQPLNKLATGAQWLLDGTGAAASNIWEGGGLVYGSRYQAALSRARAEEEGSKLASSGSSTVYTVSTQEHYNTGTAGDTTTTPLLDAPNIQYHFCPVFSDYRGGKELILHPGFQIQIDQLRPFSRGSVTLRSNDFKDAPKAQFNYFKDSRDMEELADGVRAAAEVLHQPVFDKYRGSSGMDLLDPLSASLDELKTWISKNSGTDYHPCGTCKMSGIDDDETAVVDGNTMKVRGLEGLCVVDASVMPNIVSGNLNAPVQMIAMKAADIILEKETLLEKTLPKYHFNS